MITLNPTTSSSNSENIHNSSDIKDNRFGGRREISDSVSDKDYTARTGADQNKKYNPVDETTKDIDTLADPRTRTNEFLYQENKMDAQKGNEANFIIKSDTDNLPNEDTDAFELDPSDPNFLIKRRRAKAKYHFGDGQYSNNPNRGTYEGELR